MSIRGVLSRRDRLLGCLDGPRQLKDHNLVKSRGNVDIDTDDARDHADCGGDGLT